MKNIQGTEEDLDLFNKNGVRVYAYFKYIDGHSYECTYDSNGNKLTYKDSAGYGCEYTYDSNGNVLTYKDSNGYSYECTYNSEGKELTFKDSKGLRRGFDKTYTEEEVEFIKRVVQQYWDDWNEEDPDNQNDLN